MTTADQAGAIVSIVGVRFAYGSRAVLDDLHLSIAAGESLPASLPDNGRPAVAERRDLGFLLVASGALVDPERAVEG